MKCEEIAAGVEAGFCERYRHFSQFREGEAYRGYWALCMEAVRDRELLGHIIFCNDLFRIPPVKTFLLWYREELVALTGREDAALESFVKKAIGAFWGMVFKYALGYTGQESVSVSMKGMFGVRAATCYRGMEREVRLDG